MLSSCFELSRSLYSAPRCVVVRWGPSWVLGLLIQRVPDSKLVPQLSEGRQMRRRIVHGNAQVPRGIGLGCGRTKSTFTGSVFFYAVPLTAYHHGKSAAVPLPFLTPTVFLLSSSSPLLSTRLVPAGIYDSATVFARQGIAIMPASAGRVRMPHNNRMSTSGSLQSTAIWQKTIGCVDDWMRLCVLVYIYIYILIDMQRHAKLQSKSLHLLAQ